MSTTPTIPWAPASWASSSMRWKAALYPDSHAWVTQGCSKFSPHERCSLLTYTWGQLYTLSPDRFRPCREYEFW